MKPEAFLEEDRLHLPSLTVYETDAVPAGLLDADGNPLVRQRQALGFDLSGKPRVRVKAKSERTR